MLPVILLFHNIHFKIMCYPKSLIKKEPPRSPGEFYISVINGTCLMLFIIYTTLILCDNFEQSLTNGEKDTGSCTALHCFDHKT